MYLITEETPSTVGRGTKIFNANPTLINRVFRTASLPLQAICAGAGVGSIYVSRDTDGLPCFPTQFTGGHTLSKTHGPVLTADSEDLDKAATG